MRRAVTFYIGLCLLWTTHTALAESVVVRSAVVCDFGCVNKRIPQLVEEVSKVTGVKMQVSTQPADWQTRQRTATMFAQSISAVEFRRALAGAFGCVWLVQGSADPKNYIIAASRKSQEQLQDAVEQADAEVRKWRDDGIQAAVADAHRALTMSSADADAIRDEDPWLYYLATDSKGRDYAQLLTMIPGDSWQSLAYGNTVELSIDSVSPSVRRLLEEIIGLPVSAWVEGVSERPVGSSVAWVELNPWQPNVGAGIVADLAIVARSPGSGVDTPLHTWDRFLIGPSLASGNRQRGKIYELVRDRTDASTARQAVWDDLKNSARSAGQGSPEQPWEGSENRLDRQLSQRVEHKALAGGEAEGQLTQHLRGLSKESGLTMLLETFDPANEFCRGVPSTGSVYDILECLARGCNLQWQKIGNIVILRYSDWARRRSLEVSDALVERWTALAKAQCGLLFDDLLDIVRNTTYDQLSETLTQNRVLYTAGVGDVARSQGLYLSLDILAHLKNDEQARFRSDLGLQFRYLDRLQLHGGSRRLLDVIAAGVKDKADLYVGVRVEDLDADSKEGRQKVTFFCRFPKQTFLGCHDLSRYSLVTFTPPRSRVRQALDAEASQQR